MENYFLFYHRSDTDDRMGHCLKKTFRLYTTKRDLKIKIKNTKNSAFDFPLQKKS